MKSAKWKVICIAIMMCLLPMSGHAMVFPGSSWREGTPESQNVNSARLNSALNTLARYSGSNGISETVVIREGVVIWKGNNIDRRHGIWSSTKSFTSTALGLMINEGRCSLSTLARNHEPLLANLYPTVTLRHFATMTSGYNALNEPPGRDRWGNSREDWSTNPYNPTRPLSSPGTAFLYWDEAMMMNGRVLTRIANTNLKNYLQSRLMAPIGIGSNAWSWDTEGRVGGIDINNGCTGINITARNLARFGHLFLNNGNWNGKQVVPASWVRAATRNQVPVGIENSPQGPSNGLGVYGYNWWINGIKKDGRRLMPDAPAGTFYASGFNHNVCFVIPEWHMVIVRMGTDGNPPEGKEYVWNLVLNQIKYALIDNNASPSTNTTNSNTGGSSSSSNTNNNTSNNISFTLVNAATDRDIAPLANNGTIDLSRVGNALNVRANVPTGAGISMVRFLLNGATFREEGSAPYALAGDEPAGNYLTWSPVPGSYTLRAVALNAGGATVAQNTIRFQVTRSGSSSTPQTIGAVSSTSTNGGSITFTLINAATDRDITPLVNNGTIDLSRVGNALNVRANVPTGAGISMVRFLLNGATFREEGSAPYALAGDEPAGNYLTWSPVSGSYTLRAVALNAGGATVAQNTIRFQVTRSGTGTTPSQPQANSNEIIFTLINAATDRDLYELDDNDTIDLGRVGNALNIRAEIQISTAVSMVQFFLNGASFRQERSAPYALAGDDPAGNYLSWSPTAGSYTLEAVASNASSRVVARRTIRFQVTGSTSGGTTPGTGSATTRFNRSRDLISLHFDNCADPDDGHATVADRTMIGVENIPLARVHVVSGTYGTQPDQYQSASGSVMTAAWGQNGWLNAHADWNRAVSETVAAWSKTLEAGGHVWIAEGGQSDFTAEVVRDLQAEYSTAVTRTRIHLVQHSDWNERYTAAQDLTYVRNQTDYIRIADGNQTGNGTAGLYLSYNNNADAINNFTQAAKSHATFGRMWTTAFNYLDPSIGYPRSNPNPNYRKLDFSDSVELLHILGIGTGSVSNCATFANRFLK